MESSTTRPIANTRASSVSKLMENPKIDSTRNAPIKQTGITAAGMNAARHEPRNR